MDWLQDGSWVTGWGKPLGLLIGFSIGLWWFTRKRERE